MAESDQRKTIFISYSHKDNKWLERLKTYLKPLELAGGLDVWDNQRISEGEGWHNEITRALDAASVAVLLVSPTFHASDFITEEELTALMQRATLLWAPISALA